MTTNPRLARMPALPTDVPGLSHTPGLRHRSELGERPGCRRLGRCGLGRSDLRQGKRCIRVGRRRLQVACAQQANTLTLPATKKNDEISSVVTSCTYGAQTLAALPKDVIIDYAVTSSALTAADVKKGLAQANQIKITIVPYHGLGVTAYYYSFSESGITIQGLTGFEGTKEYGGSTYSKTTSKSQLAALVRLAEKL